jgi:hypothetical protein
MNIRVLAQILFYSLIFFKPILASAEKSAPDANISVNPSSFVFGEKTPNTSTSAVTFTVKNKGTTNLTLGSLALSGNHSDHYQLGADNCSGQTLAANSSCTTLVSYAPTARGHKQATLDIPSNAPNTAVLQAFLTSREDLYQEASRRLPPVLSAVNIPETMTAGQSYDLTWTILGYHENYYSWIVIFNCKTDAVNCGNSFSSSTRLEYSSKQLGQTPTTSGWSYNGNYAKEFDYSYIFTPNTNVFTESTDIVIRFYRRNLDDDKAEVEALSLVIPGNLSVRYFDKQGRRIVKTVVPE